MASNFGTLFRISTWGESHGPGVGVVVDGCPPLIPLTVEDIQHELNRRRPGQSKIVTPRKEDDSAEILSGVLDGKTLAGIFRQFPGIECVFLNTCDSGPTALEIGQHIPYAIGMNARVFDEAAIQFAVAFYEAVASGKDIPFAFEFARNRLRMSYFPEQAAIPVLITAGQCPDPVYTDGASHLDQPSPRLPR